MENLDGKASPENDAVVLTVVIDDEV